MKKIRESNYELMRIISMFFIVVYHMIISTGGQLINHTASYTQIFLEVLSLLLIVHVNSFVLVSGYFQYDKKTSFKKVLSLIGMALFYTIVIALIFNFFGIVSVSLLDYIKIFSPLEFQNLWFLNMYIALYLLAPYINKLIKNLNQKEHRKLIILLFVMFSLIATITNQNTFANNGHTLVQFIFLYILGAYLKKYPISNNIHFKNYSNKKKFAIFLFLYFFFGIVNYLAYFFAKTLLAGDVGETVTYICEAIINNTYFYQNPLILAQSVCYFLIFETFSFKNKFINYIASMIFAIYVITETPFMLGKLYKFIGINTGTVIYGFSIVIKMFLWSIVVFVLCVGIECLRRFVIELIKKLYNKKIREV